ncbi:MAG: hypothetical protein QM594_04770 [Niabella sp.]
MTHSLIHFFTNERVPVSLQAAIEELKQKQNGKNVFKKDRRLFTLGTFFLCVFICLVALFVYSITVLF